MAGEDPARFTVGANLPWVRYGGDIGANAWSPAGGLATRPADRQRLDRLLERLAAAGVTALRWFFLCDLRAGVRFDAGGAAAGLQPEAWRDIDAALDSVGRAGMRLMPVLFDFHLCRPRRLLGGVQMGGRSRLLSQPRLRASLLDAVVTPLLARYGRVPEIAAWDLFNEPEWATFGVGTWNPVASVPRRAMRQFLHAAAARVHEQTVHEVTVGSASVLTLGLVRGLGLDFYQPHWYDHFETRAPLSRPVRELGCDRPVVLGEFPTRQSSRSPAELIAAAEQNGYAGAYFWSALAGDQHTHLDEAAAALADRISPTRRTTS